MKFTIENKKENIVSLSRLIGYTLLSGNSDEHSMVRPLVGRDYPRFHIYMKTSKTPGVFEINLHLDQKKPSYLGSRAHSGEHDGDLIEKEVGRIKNAAELN